MPSPLLLLVASAVLLGGLATLIVVVAISVDAWQEIDFDEAKLREINASTNINLESLSSTTQFYKVVLKIHGSSANVTEEVYWVHSSTNGLWRTCDHLTGKKRQR
ncbi:hypothetical protein BaRGS_00006441 [Batillaria attramentaria]|uniref:Uncharacterized protein n=1 Tax=Batillaria attramentaria TaxID=370345 RepID=A0ABD0LTN9_9CAEN